MSNLARKFDDRYDSNNDKKSKLWNLNFFLLWQGQLVSMFGDSVYSIALGFWILQVTGSTAIMGVLMGASVLPRIFLSPIGGTFVDRHNRKKIIIVTDLIRGVVITFVGIAALLGFIEVWMVLIAGLVMGICGSFFNPAISSSIPDIVDKHNLVKANSALSLLSTGTNIFGKALGGIIFQLLGAPIMFFANGISYLISAFTESFIIIPQREKTFRKLSFIEDMKEGIAYVNDFKGLKYLYATIAFLNFFGNIGIMLLLPLFNRVDFLNPKLYGLAMAFLSVGMFLGFFSLSIIDINKLKKSHLFTLSGLVSSIAMISVTLSNNFVQIAISLLVSGYCVAVTNALIQSSMQAAVLPEMRGKVSGFRTTLNSSLVPLAMAFGGIIAEFISIRLIIGISYCFVFILFIGLAFIPSVNDLINHKGN